MARYIEQGKSIFIPFKNGLSITDSQLHLRMYKTAEMFKRYFPKNTAFDELCEYAPVVRCKECVSGIPRPYTNLIHCNVMGCNGLTPDDFCSYGRKRGDSQ